MVLPLIIMIIVGVFLAVVTNFIWKIAKIILIIVALIWVYNLLKKKFNIKNLSNAGYALGAIGIFVGILTIGNHFQFFAVGALPFAVQTPLVQASLSPLNLFLGFLVVVFAMLYYTKK